MKTIKRTDGDWRAEWLDDEAGWVIADGGIYLAEMVTKDSEGLFERNKARRMGNAVLMAGAPALLSAARTVLTMLRNGAIVRPLKEVVQDCAAILEDTIVRLESRE